MGKKFQWLIADTTAFIENLPLQEYADNVVTVTDVVNEIKCKRQLKRLCVLPYDLVIDEPSPRNVSHVIDFAKKTGDYSSLSTTDIKIIALTYILQKLVPGTKFRTESVVSKLIASRETPVELIDSKPLAGFYMPSKPSNAIEAELKEQLENIHIDVNLEKPNGRDSILVESVKEPDEEGHQFESEELPEDDDPDSWITPKNLLATKSSFGNESASSDSVSVACMTTDYAVQNVLRQINLNVAALDGKVIKQLRTYILRCYACYKTTSIMTKTFCPKCGNKTLKRVAVSLDENGQQMIHINTSRPLTAKGKNTPIPRPQGGKHSSNPILFEDQPMPKQMPSRVARTKTNALDEDYVAGFSPFVQRDVHSKSALMRGKCDGINMRQWMKTLEFQNIKQNRMK